jgi:NDP-sugar pyrophosphorylase family protein
VRYSWETDILGSAGGPARAIPLLESDRFLIVNGDTLADVDLRSMAKQHIDTNALVTMAVVDGRPEYNGVIADSTGIVRGFGREPGAFHFIGIQNRECVGIRRGAPDVSRRPSTAFIPA